MVSLNGFKAFLKRKDIEFSLKRYGIDALGAMAQGLFCSLLIGTILNTLGSQTGVEIFSTVGGYATAMSGPAMAVAIGFALKCPPLVLFSLAAVGWASNALGGAGGPLAVLVVAIIAAEFGKAVSKETPIDILVTPLVTIFIGVALAALMPIVAGMAGNSGNQTLTLLVRSLAMGQVTDANKSDLLKKEVAVAVINGLVWGVIAALCAWALYWDTPEGLMLGFVMFLAMLLNIIVGAVVGLAVPLLLRYFGRDPAMGGSVLLTFTTDSGGFLIFLGLATFFFRNVPAV